MKGGQQIFYVFLVVLINDLVFVRALRCKVPNNPSDEEMKKIARSCMKKITEDSNEDNGKKSNSESDGNSSEEHTKSRNTWEKFQGREGRGKRTFKEDDQRRGRYDRHGSRRYHRKENNSTSDNRNEEKQHNKECIIHCFFEELNMLNAEEFPDRHKVLYVLTKDIQDLELRSFYTDTIQECFHFLEMEDKEDKCDFAKSLVHCMAEYARNNCEDWNHSMMFT